MTLIGFGTFKVGQRKARNGRNPQTGKEIERDTHDRTRAEEALGFSEAQKQAILDASVDRIRLVDPDMRIIWVNKTITKELNMAPEELVDQHCFEVLVGRHAPCPRCPTKKALKSGKRW